MIIEIKNINDELNELYNKYFNINLSFNDPFKKIYCYISDDRIVGFIDYSLIYDRIELNYILVVEKYRLSKVASNLMGKMLEEKVNSISLEVSVDNEPAIKLYRKYKFDIVSTRKNYYNGIDAYLMLRKS